VTFKISVPLMQLWLN